MTIPNEDTFKRNLKSAVVLYLASAFIAIIALTANSLV